MVTEHYCMPISLFVYIAMYVFLKEFMFSKNGSFAVVFPLHTVPSATVQSLSGVNSSSTNLTISWQPPPADDQNGIIRAYNVSYGLPAQEPSSYTTESTPNEMIELIGLEKFTEYLVIVNAFTVGPGPSASVTVRTDSDRELSRH